MSLVSKWLLALAGHSPREALALARTNQSIERTALERDLAQDEDRFNARMASVGRQVHVPVGTTDTGGAYTIPLNDLTSLPAWITAATGAGKSRFVGSLMESVVRASRRGASVSLVLVDGKGETADNLLRAVAGIAQELPGRERVDFLRRIHTLRFFSRDFLPSWPLTHRVTGIAPDVQASALADVLCNVVGDATVGARQRATLAAVLAVAIEFGVPMASLPWLLAQPEAVMMLAARSALPSIRLNLSRLARESQGSIDGLVARLGTLLRVPSLKAVLSGERPFDFAQCFEPGSVTVLDFGGADLGNEAGVRAMGSLAITALVNAAFDPRRTVRGTTMLVADEPQVLLTSVTVGQLERLVTLGRSFGAGGLVCVHQGATQLAAELQTVLNTNVPLRVLGRSAERDAQASSEWLARTGRVPHRREPGARTPAGFLSPAEEERFRVNELGHLPPRHFLVADRRADFSPRIVRALDFNPPPWTALDPSVADAVRRGTVGVPRAVLEGRVRVIEEEASRAFEARPAPTGSARGRRAAPVETPDVIGPARKRGRRGEVP